MQNGKDKKSFIEQFFFDQKTLWKQNITKNNLFLFPTLPFFPVNIFNMGKCNVTEIAFKKVTLLKYTANMWSKTKSCISFVSSLNKYSAQERKSNQKRSDNIIHHDPSLSLRTYICVPPRLNQNPCLFILEWFDSDVTIPCFYSD